MKKSFYDEYYQIESTHWWFIGRRRILATILDEYVGRNDQQRILDLGCGTGKMLQFLQDWGQPIGADVDRSAVVFCRQRGCQAIVHCAAEALPFVDGSMNAITAFDLLEHVVDDGRVLGEAHRVCRTGGKFVASVPAFSFLWGRQDEISNHQRRYTASQLKGRIVNMGLTLLKISYLNTLLFPVIFAIRITRRIRDTVLPTHQRACVSDFSMTSPGRLNDLLARVFSLEALLLDKMNLPLGVSILVVAQKSLR